MNHEIPHCDCECETGPCLVGVGVMLIVASITASIVWPDRIPSMGWAIITSIFVYLLMASLAVIWFSLKRAKDRANELVSEMTREETVESQKTTELAAVKGGISKTPYLAPRLIDRYNDLGIPVWPLVYQRYLVAAFAAVIALISLLGLLAHWPSPEEGRGAKPEAGAKISEGAKKDP